MPVYHCLHILTEGRQCGAPALRGQEFCYWHTEFRRQQRELDDEARRAPEFIAPAFDSGTGEFRSMYAVRPQDIHATRGVMRKPLELKLGVLEDSNSIQVAIANVLTALAAGRLENRRASILLYGLQLAAANCRALTPPAKDSKPVAASLLPPETRTTFDLPEGVAFLPERPDPPAPNNLTTAAEALTTGSAAAPTPNQPPAEPSPNSLPSGI